MKLSRNEYCPIHRSRFCCGRQQSKKERKLRLGVQRVEDPHHPRGIASFVHQPRCASCSTGRSPSRAESAESATRLLSIAARSSPTISSQEEWEQHDETIIRITFRLCIDGAMARRGRKELVYQGRG